MQQTTADGPGEWRGEPLPRGRHKLRPEAVRASQRERLLRAMLECVAADGYEAVTVSAVVRRARVSPNAFYANFEDKDDCFTAGSDALVEDLLRDFTSFAAEPSWVSALSKGIALYLQRWTEQPAFTRAYLLGTGSGSARAGAQRERAYERFCLLFDALALRARIEQPSLPPLLPRASRALVVAITDLVTAEVAAGRTEHLPALAPAIMDLAVVLLAGQRPTLGPDG